MRVGLIARSEDRGLGVQTWEFYRHLRPDATLLIDMGKLDGGFAAHPERFPDAQLVHFLDERLVEVDVVRDFLTAVDVVYTAETCYDWRVPTWAAEARTGLVVHANPEFYHHPIDKSRPHPTAWWAPTSWRLGHLPAETRVVEVPCSVDLFPSTVAAAPESHQEARWLHVVGHKAAGDRNGTTLLLRALRKLRHRHVVTMTSQGESLPSTRALGPGVTVEYRTDQPVANRTDLYAGHHALVLPRRYGGLCLPALEAMSAGLMVVMSAASPNEAWPGPRVAAVRAGQLHLHSGRMTLMATNIPDLSRTMDLFAGDAEQLAAGQAEARAWAVAHSWDNLTQLYVDELTRVADLV